MKGGFGCSPCCGQQNPCTECSVYSQPVGVAIVRIAGRFVTPSGGLTLSSATLEIDTSADTSGSPSVSNYVVELYSNTVDELGRETPDALLLTLTGPASVSSSMTWTAPDEPLTGSTAYWIALGCTLTFDYVGWFIEQCSAPAGEDNSPCEIYWTSSASGSPGGGKVWLSAPIGDARFLFTIN